jgi:uncharacterized membrane protein
MIFNTKPDFNYNNKNAKYENSINNLEKARTILDNRFQRKEVENKNYIKIEHQIQARIDQFKQKINKE